MNSILFWSIFGLNLVHFDAGGAMCHAMGAADPTNGPYLLAGVESGNQCFCDAKRNPTYPEGNKRAVGCTMPCTGAPTTMCGGAGFIEIYQIDCGSDWGLGFLIFMSVGVAGYVRFHTKDDDFNLKLRVVY